jgi:hypothetical protein
MAGPNLERCVLVSGMDEVGFGKARANGGDEICQWVTGWGHDLAG